MSEQNFGREHNRRQRWLDMRAELSADLDTEGDVLFVTEPCRVPAPCTVPVVPGNAAAARRNGCEDAYDNDMEARYGEGF
jgi:hypothetical protein